MGKLIWNQNSYCLNLGNQILQGTHNWNCYYNRYNSRNDITRATRFESCFISSSFSFSLLTHLTSFIFFASFLLFIYIFFSLFFPILLLCIIISFYHFFTLFTLFSSFYDSFPVFDFKSFRYLVYLFLPFFLL